MDEAKCAANKEWMSIVIRFVAKGEVKERFVTITYVSDTKAKTLFEAGKKALMDLGFDIKKLRGQGRCIFCNTSSQTDVSKTPY